MKDPEDEAFEQLALRQGQWDYSGQNTSGWRKKQIMDTQAFPNPHRTDMTGMTLRDYFAAKASEEDIEEHLNGPKAEHIVKDSGGMHRIVHKNTIYTREQAKYRYADAMLKAREA